MNPRDKTFGGVAESDKRDVAVVFIHGIGSQVQGSTLLNWAEPLQRLLLSAGPSHGFRSRVATAVDLVGENPELTLEISRDDGQQATWLLTEARWAQAFHPSPASDVLQWAARFSWRTIRRLFAVLFTQFGFVIIRKLTPFVRKMFPRTSGFIGFLFSLVVWVVSLFLYGSFFFILLAPYVVLGVVLLAVGPLLVVIAVPLLLALIVLQHVPILGRRLAPVVAGLVTSIGDAQVYRARAIQAAAMRQVLFERVEQAARRARSVVVVAHSQGAAISCRAFLESATWPAYLVTVGAGTTLLNQEESVTQWRALGSPPWVNVWTPLDPVPAGPLGDGAEQVRSRLLETVWHHTSDGGFRVTSHDGLRVLGWVPGAGPDCWSGSDDLVEQARSSRGQAFDKKALAIRTQEPVRVALDEKEAQLIAAALLGVPSGEHPIWVKTPIPRTFNTPGPEEWPVANRYSLIRDHTTYAENLTQVQQPLAHLLLDQAEATANSLPAPSSRAEEWHMVRVRALAMSRLVAAVTAAALVGLLVTLDMEAPLLSAVSWAADHWEAGGDVLGSLSERFGASLVLSVVGLAAFAVLSGVMSSTWVSWHDRESLRLCGDPDGSRVRLGFSGFLFGAGYLLALILSFLWWLQTVYAETIPLAAVPAFLLVPAYLLWGLVWPFLGLRPRRLPARD